MRSEPLDRPGHRRQEAPQEMEPDGPEQLVEWDQGMGPA
jgi:hypothetical protein